MTIIRKKLYKEDWKIAKQRVLEWQNDWGTAMLASPSNVVKKYDPHTILDQDTSGFTQANCEKYG